MPLVVCPICTAPDDAISTLHLETVGGEFRVKDETKHRPACVMCNNAGSLEESILALYARNHAKLVELMKHTTLKRSALAKLVGVSTAVLTRMVEGLGPITESQLNKLTPFIPIKESL